jgi:hypothetical protein
LLTDLIGRVRNGETPPFRPILCDESAQDASLVTLMKDCWDEDAERRPEFAAIKNRLNNVNKGKYVLFALVGLCQSYNSVV